MKLLLLGPVGSGKGTLATIVSNKYNIPQISTGEIFRWNIKNETELGKLAKQYVNVGQLVPDSVTNKLVEDRLKKEDCKNGYILDGYPRNVAQAKELDKIQKLDKVVLINISEEKILERLSSRRMCKVCNQPTAIKFLVDGKCEKCGGEVYIRDDDKPEVVLVRLKTNSISDELINFYKQKGIFYKFDAVDDIDKNFESLDAILRK